MTGKTKAVNYTAEQTAALVQGYLAGEPVAGLAAAFGKTTRSVIAKLSREGVYVKKEYTNKNGEKPIKKDMTAEAIGTMVGLSEGEVGSLTKANKTALMKILVRIAELTPIKVNDPCGILANDMKD